MTSFAAPPLQPGRDPLARAHPPVSAWGALDLDLPAYLARIGHSGPTSADLTTLTAVHRAHLAEVPFENLDLVLGRGVDLELGALQRKMAVGGRGGYCYESNLLLAAALDRLGFTTVRLLVRTQDPVTDPRPRGHLLVLVHLDEVWWVCDVGFGSGPLEPVALEDPTPVTQGAWTWRVTRGPDGWWRLQELQGAQWVTAYTIAGEVTYPVDVQVANHHTATHPASPFLRRPIVVRRSQDVERRLVGRELTVMRPDRTQTTSILADHEYAAVLATLGLHLDDAEVHALLESCDA